MSSFSLALLCVCEANVVIFTGSIVCVWGKCRHFHWLSCVCEGGLEHKQCQTHYNRARERIVRSNTYNRWVNVSMNLATDGSTSATVTWMLHNPLSLLLSVKCLKILDLGHPRTQWNKWKWRHLPFPIYTRVHVLCLLKLRFLQTGRFCYGKEDLIPRGCKLRSFRIKIKTFLESSSVHRFQSTPPEIRSYFSVSNIHAWSENRGSDIQKQMSSP